MKVKKIQMPSESEIRRRAARVKEEIMVTQEKANETAILTFDKETGAIDLNTDSETGNNVPTIKMLAFMDYNSDNLQKIGPKHQVLGLTYKGKYMLGNTYINEYSGLVTSSLSYVTKIAKLD